MERREIRHRAGIGRHRRQHVVVQRTLVVVGKLRTAIAPEQPRGQLEHVVGIAGFGGRRREYLSAVDRRAGLHAGLIEPFVHRRAAVGKRMPVHDQPPEVRGRLQFQRVAIDVRGVGQAHDLRDVRIGVQAPQPVLAVGKRADEPGAMEHAGGVAMRDAADR